jgi:hypothetical protein
MALVQHDPEEELRAALAQSAAEFGQRAREDAAAEAAFAAATRRSLQEHGDTSASAIPLDTPPRPAAPTSSSPIDLDTPPAAAAVPASGSRRTRARR